MTKTLKDFLEVYKPKSPDEQKFVDKHVVIKHKDRNGNGDDVFNGNTKTIKRKEERKGYDVGDDEKVYEALKGDQHKIDANKNGKVDAHDFHLLRKKKKVAEEVDTVLDEALDLLLSIDEKTLTPAEMKKREEVVKAIKRDDPKMDKSMAYAIATKTAKRVAEDTEELDESAKIAAHLIKRYGDNVRKSHVVSAANDFGVDASKLAKAVRTKLGKTSLAEEDDGWYTHSQMYGSKKSEKHPKGISAAEWKSGIRWHHGKNKRINIKEELEELDELSAKKLTDYTAAASDASKHKNLSTAKLDKRYGSMALAHEKVRARHAKVAAEGYMPTADEPTEANKKTAQKVRDMMAKEKKPVKEDTQIDELSKNAMLKYLSANKKSDKAAQEKGDYSKSDKRMRGTDVAVRKYTASPNSKYVRVPATEEVEIEEAYGMYKVEFPKQHAGKQVAAGSVHVKAQNTAHAHKVAAKRVGVDSAVFKSNVTKSSVLPEEVEAIDELSTEKLVAYRKKAKAGDIPVRRGVGIDTADEKIKNKTGVYNPGLLQRAKAKLRNEEADQIDELSKKTMGSYIKKASGAEQPKNVMSPKNVPLTKIAAYQGDSETGHFGKRFNQHTYDKAERLRKNREQGITRATDKLTKEEVEAIDELSKKTLGSYVNKAAERIGTQGITTGLKIANDENSKKNLKTMGKRQKGIAKAVDKLTKEDIINRTIEKYVPEDIKFTPEERLLKRINGLSEAHVQTLLGLFEDLNKDNQNKMIETVETHEGINQILNFVLENRGK